jgi:ADP-heptose:LPS heptosyltransferase
MNTLIAKLGASGDVVRTTPLLTALTSQVTWLTAARNVVLLEGLTDNLRSFSWEKRAKVLDTRYDLVVNLEDTLDVAEFLKTVEYREVFGGLR